MKGSRMKIKSGLDKIYKEIELLKLFAHQNVVTLYEIINDEENDKLYLIIDNCENGEIMSWSADTYKFTPYTGRDEFSEDEIRGFMRDIVDGLMYIHNTNVVHRDIKPQNILVTSSHHCKIGDFGVAMLLPEDGDDTLDCTQGTYHFMPPECWNF